MNADLGAGRYLWSFRRIVGQMQHDLFHVYTVDQHIADGVAQYARASSWPSTRTNTRCALQLASGWDKPWLLYLASPVSRHWQRPGGDHSEIGAIEVRRFARQHNMAQPRCRAGRISGARAPADEHRGAKARHQ